jgi:putative transposase
MRKAYQSDLSDAEWSCLQPHLPVPEFTGCPKTHSTREILNAIFYIVGGGCAWRLLPHDLGLPGRRSTTISVSGVWTEPARGCTRPSAPEGASPPREEPSAQRRDSRQPVAQDHRGRRHRARIRRGQEGQRKKAPSSSGHAGIGARSESSQRQCHRPRVGIKLLLEPSSSDRLPRLSHLWLDAGYTGQDKGAGWVERALGWSAEIVRHPPKPAPEEVIDEVGEGVRKRGDPHRQREVHVGARPKAVPAEEVDRGEDILLAFAEQEDEPMDYERLPESSEAFIYVAMSRLMARRLARS